MTRLDSLYLEHGQSAWVDNIRRDWIEDGTLQDLVDRGVVGRRDWTELERRARAFSDAVRTARFQ